MPLDSVLRLFGLSAIWGGSFLFMRMAAPVFGPAWLVFGRVGFAAIFLFILAHILRKNRDLLKNWKHFTIVSFLNSALPFFCFGAAALTLTTSQLAVLNATAPAWGYLVGLGIGAESFSARRVLGIILGTLGVYVIFQGPEIVHTQDFYIAVALCLLAALSYGVATNYAKHAKSVEPFANAYGSMCYATLLVVPALFFFPMKGAVTVEASLAVLAIGVICSGVAYLIYFRLIRDVGATSALTVTFLVPLFGTLWGCLFLQESLSATAIAGMAIVILGTALVTGFSPKALFKKKRK